MIVTTSWPPPLIFVYFSLDPEATSLSRLVCVALSLTHPVESDPLPP